MRTHIALMLLAGSLAATPVAAQTVSQPSDGPRLLEVPSGTPTCTASQGRIGSDRVLVTALTFTLRGARNREIGMLVDSTDRVLMLTDDETPPGPDGSARSTRASAFLTAEPPTGNFAGSEPRPLTAEELERAKSLSRWLLARRCAVGSR